MSWFNLRRWGWPILVCVWLGISPAWAATYHVFRDTNADGTLNDCTNTEHSVDGTANGAELQWCDNPGGTYDHYMIGSCGVPRCITSLGCTGASGVVRNAESGNTFSYEGGGVDTTVYGTAQAGLTATTGNGDYLELHAGTYDYAVDGGSTTLTYSASSEQTFLCIPAGSATQESHRRVIRGACETYGGTCSGTQDVPIITATTTSGIEQAIVFGCTDSSTANVDYVTIQSLEIVGFDPGAGSGTYRGIVQEKGSMDYAVIDNITVRDTGASVYSQSAFGIAGAGDGSSSGTGWSDFGVIKNSTVGPNHNGDTLTFDADGKACDMDGWVIKDNSFATTIGGGAGKGFMRLKGFCGVFYNNYFDAESDQDADFHWRQNSGPIYFFNNYVRHGGDLVFIQCTGCTDVAGDELELYYFNNTHHRVGLSGDGFAPVDIPGLSATSRVLNNIWDGHGQPLDCSGTNAGMGVNGYSAYDGTAYSTGCTVDSDLGNNVTTGDPWWNATGNEPTPFYQIASGSENVVGAGTNDPLNQGASLCSINPVSVFGCADAGSESCATIDCKLDYDGDARGGSWDIGADEFAAEATETICNDSTDNDFDGNTDCADSDCDGQTGASGETCEFGTEVSCTDTYDNDADGSSDCADNDCDGDPACGIVEGTTGGRFSGVTLKGVKIK